MTDWKMEEIRFDAEMIILPLIAIYLNKKKNTNFKLKIKDT